ncbi:hypothetical protein CB0940_04543 [Cercospora beticola]|uniref:Uncharacterized protein n=1 Tax=Cercospora beticola TaxID=122368 RepID=A0A2G5HJ39_CERBT|nr:hypothetical protein CB0940_04543 [Cercospora beticola]PIA92574.1 hypothetical protein CB0940_04543 [Cercospora beticola]WPB01792.1 hypothetical protein RHO25_006424 [Cercospora beticola]CAK1363377.1 unnamed protein product [Cercospora beticola]
MYIHPGLAVTFATYPSPPSLAADTPLQYPDDELFLMGANTNVNVDGVGVLNYQRAIDIARNSEGELDPMVSAYLEGALTDIWNRVTLQPDEYVMTKDEFAVFNFYRRRFEENEVAEHAVARYWANTYECPAAST